MRWYRTPSVAHTAATHWGTNAVKAETERRAIRFVLAELMRAGEGWLRTPPSGAVRAKQVAEARFSALGRGELERHLNENTCTGDFGEAALYLIPPADQKNAPTVLWCRWDLYGGRCSFSYYLGMWLTHNQFIGFRFEMPNKRGDNHNYYHSQPCRAIGRRRDVIEGALAIPVGNPTWPLAAESALDLLLCVVLSIHGMNGLRELDRTAKQDIEMREQGEALLPALRRMLNLPK